MRGQSFDGYRPSIAPAGQCGCPIPHAVAEIAFPKGSHLFHQGDHARGGFSLTSGLVAQERVNEDGDMVILKLLQPGAFFPCADLFTDGLHTTGARALTDVSVCFIPTDRLIASMADPAIRAIILRRGGEEARESESIIFRLCAADLGERIMAVLQQLAASEPCNDHGRQVLNLPLSWRDVAAMVGTSPEVLSRTLRKLAENGRIAFAGRRVTLLHQPPREGRTTAMSRNCMGR
ncbi:MAG: Crp/Fnr family transcriptional regulator [Magnetospirillum sp.]|nr:Crp/Fnr family transcriptional regulator [Magnetospirillum sp.]